MFIELTNIKPTYMSEEELSSSDIYLRDKVVFEKNKKYLVLANSGHGKTSILNFIYGSNINYTGSIHYHDHAQEQDIIKLRQTKISYIFQDLKLFSELSILENIQLKNLLTNHKSVHEIEELLCLVKLDHKKDSLVRKLSLGQRQRVAIIRALCQPFEFLLMDEPFSHLDKSNAEIIASIINKEVEEQQASIIHTALGEDHLFKYDNTLYL